MLVKPDKTAAWAIDGVRERSVTRHRASASSRLFITVRSSSDQSIYVERDRQVVRLFIMVVRKKPIAASMRYSSSVKNGANPGKMSTVVPMRKPITE